MVGLELGERRRLIERDFVERQYYVTGRLTAGLYREDCVFDGPDPDVPVRGLRKYVDATRGLFFRPASKVELLAIEEDGAGGVVAWWRLEGVLNLPWRPAIKPYTGRTRYVFDADGLVLRHEEEWAIGVVDAFGSTLFPRLGGRFGAPPAPSAQELVQAWRARGVAFDAYASASGGGGAAAPPRGEANRV
jgi:hypothetical protein